jgi:chlorite dismutase
MLGRSYASGYEQDLEDWLLRKPRRTAFNPEWPWAVWYPLRRTGAFAKLPHQEQGAILREHGMIGKAYGEADLAHDIRLACHGLDAHDNEFVIGLVGRELYPLSHVVQSMRKTRQTAEYMQSMGPFFVGHALWQSPAPQNP